MLASLRTGAVFGLEASAVHVEVDVSFGFPSFTMVGLPDASVRESRDRVRSAIRNSGYEFPPHRITVNLAPADVRKAGSAFDLPIALGVLAASGVLERRAVADIIVLGELSLDGAIQATRGVLPIAVAARREGLRGLLLPRANAGEAAIVESLAVFPVSTLAEAVAAINAPDAAQTHGTAGSSPASTPSAPSASPGSPGTLEPLPDLADVRGQLLARRALEIASAGGHHLLFVGPPGAGKTMMARRLPGILPPLTFDEALEVTAIHSVAGSLPSGSGLIAARPFRAPHHTISQVALVGGGAHPRPGEISLAHHGVLFLDELLEFRRDVLEALRQPIEHGRLTIARAARTVVFPARLVLVAAMNPCPCGFAGDRKKVCRCTPLQVDRYRSRLSGPLRDRIDLVVDVPALPPDALESAAGGERSCAVRARVVAARARQSARNADEAGGAGSTNAQLVGAALARVAHPDRGGSELLRRASERFGLSARGYDGVRRVARTIADLDGSDGVSADHIAEALQFLRLNEA